MFAVGTIPVVFFTIVAMASLGGVLTSDIGSRTTTQLGAARAILDQGRGRLADTARTYAEWSRLLDGVAARDLAGIKAGILDFQVATGLADGSLLVLGADGVGSGEAALLEALRDVAPDTQSAYVGLPDGVYQVAVAPIRLQGTPGTSDRLVMASRLGAGVVASLRSATGWEVGVLSSAGGITVATSLELIPPLTQPFSSGSVATWDGRVAVGTAVLPGPDGGVAGYLAIATPADRFSSLPGRVALLLILVVLATLVAATILAAVLNRVVDRRARRVEAALGAVAAGDLSVRLPEGPAGSLERLAGSHNRLAALLERREDQLRSLADALLAIPTDAELTVIAGTALQSLRDILDVQGAAILDEDGAVLGQAGSLGGAVATDEAVVPAGGAAVTVEASLEPGLPEARLVVVTVPGQPLSPWDRSLVQLAAAQLGSLLRDARLFAGASQRADDLDRLSRLQSNFLRGVSHNLNGPLTSIQMLAEDLVEQPGTAVARERAGAIAGETGRLRRLVEELLVMARLDAGTLRLSLTPFAAVPVLRRIWATQQSDREFRIEDRSQGRLVVADRAAFEQVAWMLFDNALTYAPDGPVSVRVEPCGDAAAPRLRISVRDAGPGVPPDERELIFHRFQRGSTSDGTRGTGLGLDVARGLLTAMDGQIWCEGPATGGGAERGPRRAQPQRTGAVFVMILPAEDAAPD